MFWWRKRRERELADAREEALRWYERLGGQVMNLGGSDPAVKQALSDAGERYTAAGAQLERSTSPKQYELARETALEGLHYIRAARLAMGIDPGPELPQLMAQRGTGQITQDREVDLQGQHLKASPRPGGDTPYYYPGGRVEGRPVPAGWYSTPWWKTALVGAAGALGTMMVFDALFSPAFGGYDAGFMDGVDYADAHDGVGDGGDMGGDGGGDAGGDFGGDSFGGYDYGGGGDFGDFGGDF